MDMAAFELVSAKYLDAVIEPFWLNYFRDWGSKIDYNKNAELKKIEKFVPKNKNCALEKILRSLPCEVLGEETPLDQRSRIIGVEMKFENCTVTLHWVN